MVTRIAASVVLVALIGCAGADAEPVESSEGAFSAPNPTIEPGTYDSDSSQLIVGGSFLIVDGIFTGNHDTCLARPAGTRADAVHALGENCAFDLRPVDGGLEATGKLDDGTELNAVVFKARPDNALVGSYGATTYDRAHKVQVDITQSSNASIDVSLSVDGALLLPPTIATPQGGRLYGGYVMNGAGRCTISVLVTRADKGYTVSLLPSSGACEHRDTISMLTLRPR